MQKLVIHTQYRENYGYPEWDGKGEVPQYWKFKGGNTYVLPNFKDFSEAGKVVARLAAFIQYSNEASEEYITTWSVVPHSEKVSESWETETQIHIDGDKITAMRVVDNRDDGWMRKEILEKTESWTMLPASDRADYKAEFLMDDGDFAIGDSGLKEWFSNKEAAWHGTEKF